MADRKDIKSLLAYLSMAFPNFQPDVESPINTVDVFLDLLGDLDPDTLKLAVRAACSQPGRAFAPSAGEIRGAMVRLNIQAANVPSAGEAWQEVLDTIREQGCHCGTPDFSHPLVRKAVLAIGFETIGMSEDVMVERAHFLKIYTSLLERATEDAAMLPESIEYVQSQKQIDGGIKMLTDKLGIRG